MYILFESRSPCYAIKIDTRGTVFFSCTQHIRCSLRINQLIRSSLRINQRHEETACVLVQDKKRIQSPVSDRVVIVVAGTMESADASRVGPASAQNSEGKPWS